MARRRVTSLVGQTELVAAFTLDEIDWRLPDVSGIVGGSGVLVVSIDEARLLRSWLSERGYVVHDLDFAHPFANILRQVGLMFRWEEEFGYRLEDGDGNLDAVRDGFEFSAENRGRTALFIKDADAPDVARRWLLGLLSIAAEHSKYHLAVGARFLTILPLCEESDLIGAQFDQDVVGSPWAMNLPTEAS